LIRKSDRKDQYGALRGQLCVYVESILPRGGTGYGVMESVARRTKVAIPASPGRRKAVGEGRGWDIISFKPRDCMARENENAWA